MATNQQSVSFDYKLPAEPKDTQSLSAEDIKDLYNAVHILADQIEIIKARLTAAGIP